MTRISYKTLEGVGRGGGVFDQGSHNVTRGGGISQALSRDAEAKIKQDNSVDENL